ncbi:unknown [Orgyia pseudotsugata multiple nucleopolyhedrovirus]|uniref:Uncharacterized 16.5 kDa protein n=1 Tax=Orgyia pseudotsugata multicapsid polyhedrosis virus TaxID=262177 RepID=Y028_NPVOP|nr:hypothetical protein OpmnVgp040 [Orgyia pseudotsugata multiple nucleopolyhedrovirus]O10295.1 RecName: Full=Uncharacterized 16.5 kDa protein [Orgyia pseudotsugata multiple nucleopolyhedrovirus]pir/T10309/ hypothetical protein 40 - Orgyia pseudotsugata nuclear polyhedrosis virus [Orgyia pseudotsugata single capsid nuclopolyhedrovirus]AAC59039.1 unknown [Orgyia pseudotsugata multiple nucleopolyhedrovirus]
MMELQYNGQGYSKRFSRELVALMCAGAVSGIDWRRSSRRRLRVRDARVFSRLQRCSERYFWPDGTRFWCHARKRRRSPSLPARRPPTPREDALEDYAKEYGYDREDGEIYDREDGEIYDREDGEITPVYTRLKSLVVK